MAGKLMLVISRRLPFTHHIDISKELHPPESMTREDTRQQLRCLLHSSFGSHTQLVLWTPTGRPIVKGVYTGFNVPCSLEDHWAIW